MRKVARNAITAGVLLLILVGALATRLYRLNYESLHFDEAWNLELSTGRGSVQERLKTDTVLPQVPRPTSLAGAPPVTAIWTHMDYVTHPPLYSIVLRLWREVAGGGDVAARVLSVALSLTCLLVLFDLVRMLNGTSSALWACALAGVAGSHIELAQEVRPYMLCLLLSISAADVLVRIERNGMRAMRAIALSLLTLGMVLTHYFSAGIALALFVYALLRCRKAAWPMVVAGVIFLGSWGPMLWQQREWFTTTADNWLTDSSPGHVARTLQRFCGLPLRLLYEPTQRMTWVSWGSVLALVLPFVMLRWRRDLLLWCLWLVGSVGMLLVLDLARSTWHLALVRYALLGSPAVFAVLAAIAATIPNRFIRHAIPLAALLGAVAALPTTYYRAKPDFRLLARHIDQRIKPGEVVIFSRLGGTDYQHRVLFLSTSHASATYPWPVVLLTTKPSRDLQEQLRAYSACWVISEANDIGAAPLVDGWVESDGTQLGRSIYVRKLQIRTEPRSDR